MPDADYFSRLLPTLTERSSRTAISLLGFKPLAARLRELFESPCGAPGALLADPTFEATFGWEVADQPIQKLGGELLHEELIRAISAKEAGDHAFPQHRHPYQHQLESWKILGRDDPQSLVVTSSTGSGKTECFLVPILDYLVRQSHGQSAPLEGVSALFLYPLNALINNQRQRLGAWTSPFKEKIRFCLYNGNTQEKAKSGSSVSEMSVSEVPDRCSLRNSPPPIMVTNVTMLEYMLVRPEDKPILDHSQGKLAWVVLDEAHTYIGSQAAEIALLLRRVMHAFAVEPGKVRFIATSATLGEGQENDLRCFLADMAGVEIGQVHLVAGKRHIPSLPAMRSNASPERCDMEALAEIDKHQEQSSRRYAALSQHRVAQNIRHLFTNRSSDSVARLSEVCEQLPEGNTASSKTDDRQAKALQWLDLLSGTCNTDGEAFLPLRAHLFHQTLSGIWACADHGCPQKPEALRKQPDWPYGELSLNPVKHCPCGAPVYEVVCCNDCRQVYLLAEEKDDFLHHPKSLRMLDDFELDDATATSADDDEETAGSAAPPTGRTGDGHAVLIANGQHEKTGELFIERKERRIVDSPTNDTLTLRVQEEGTTGLTCPACSATAKKNGPFYRHGRLSTHALLGTIVPTLLEHAPDGQKHMDHPCRGRKLLSFTDNRQGTAREAARLQQAAERNRIRALVYHLVLQHARQDDPAQREALQKELKTLEASGGTGLEKLIKDRKQKLDKLNEPQPVPFCRLAQELCKQDNHLQSMGQFYKDKSDLFAGDSVNLAKMFLVREFARRPKHANNLETMGLVATCYPALEAIKTVPATLAQYPETKKFFDLPAWHDFLKMVLDFFIRTGGSLDFDRAWKNWLGMPFSQTWLRSPKEKEKSAKQRYWPDARRAQISLPVAWLTRALKKVDPQSPDYGQDVINQVLGEAWDALKNRLLSPQADGWKLTLDKLAFLPVDKAFICPVTHRFLDTTLRKVTPYLPQKQVQEETFSCEPVVIPAYPAPFDGEGDEPDRLQRFRQWLKETPAIQTLRDQGVWSNLNDRVIELTPFFKVAEHSAQQPAKRLQDYEKDFQEGNINVLCCSTTMEMGIDIGGVSMVAMHNVPPHPANYLQRAGRSGRRREGRSVTMTLCKANPHDQTVFADTRWAWQTTLYAPRVSLDSPVIVQRHVHALLLTQWFQDRKNGNDLLKLQCGAFFLDLEGVAHKEKSGAASFSAWCRSKSGQLTKNLEKALEQLLRGTVYERTAPGRRLKEAAERMQTLATDWLNQWKRLNEEQKEIKEYRDGEKSPAFKACDYRLKRLKGEYLLKDLGNRGFLPAHGFPSHIVPFDYYTVDQFRRNRRNEQDEEREDNRLRARDMPSRKLDIALRDYAPGADTVIDGMVYRSAGLTLNWKIPADQEDIHEVQNIKFVWHCKQCGAFDTTQHFEDAQQCHNCGEGTRPETFIEPAGFAVDFYESPSNNVDSQQFIPVEPPRISLGEAKWNLLPNPDLGRFRFTSEGHLYHQSRGVHGTGYALCLICGRAEPMPSDGRTTSLVFQKPHRKLRRSKNDTEFCPGSDKEWKIKQNIALGAESRTDACELQLKTATGTWLVDEKATTTLAVALRNALAALIGVQSTELDCATRAVRVAGEARQSIFLFDRHAAGYVSSVTEHLPRLFGKTREKLDCPAQCDSVCPRCVLGFDRRFAAEDMDRHAALKVLTPEWVEGLRLPPEHQCFGEATRQVLEPLTESLWQTVSSGHFGEALHLYAGDLLDDWDIARSPLRKLAYQLAAKGHAVNLVVPKAVVHQLDTADRQLLASLADAPHITVHACADQPRCGQAWLLAEAIGAEKIRRWAGASKVALRFDEHWGQINDSLLLSADVEMPMADRPRLERLDADSLRSASGLATGACKLEIDRKLNGPLKTFGMRFWQHLVRQDERTQTLLSRESPALVTKVRYQDRYLFAPLVVRLLHGVTIALQTYVGKTRWPDPAVHIQTLARKHDGDDDSGKWPRWLTDDWKNMDHRDEVIQSLFAENGIQTQLVTDEKQAHARLFEVGFNSGQKLSLWLDQGFSYWCVNENAARGDEKTFNFGEKAGKQADNLRQANPPIRCREFPTEVFIVIEDKTVIA